VVTVLLHYFFLATFSWMLCEGIVIYVLLVKVFYEGFFKRLPIYLVVGWGMLTIVHCRSINCTAIFCRHYQNCVVLSVSINELFVLYVIIIPQPQVFCLKYVNEPKSLWPYACASIYSANTYLCYK